MFANICHLLLEFSSLSSQDSELVPDQHLHKSVQKFALYILLRDKMLYGLEGKIIS